MATRQISDKLGSGEIQKICLRNDTSPYGEVLTRQEIEDSIAQTVDRMYWRGAYDPAVLYNYQDVVRDGNWLMVANKQTQDRPAPQPIGEAINEYTAAPVWNENSYTGVVVAGYEYELLKNGWLSEVEIYVPELSDSYNYRIIIINVTDPEEPVAEVIDDPLLTENDWRTVKLTNYLVGAGSKFRVLIDVLNSGSATIVTGGWTYNGSSQIITVPASAGWTKNNDNDTIRIDKTDLDATDRSTELMSFITGTEIQFASTAAPVNTKSFYVVGPPLDAGTYVEYSVSLIAEVGIFPADTPTTLNANIPAPQPTKFVDSVDFFVANPPRDWCAITPILELNGVPQSAIENTAFGVRLTFQEATSSDDWDAAAVSNIAGASGGGQSEKAIYEVSKVSDHLVTDAAFEPLVSIPLVEAPAGWYEYKFSVLYTINSTVNSAFFRYSTDGGSTWWEIRSESKDAADQVPLTYFFPIQYSGETNNLSLAIEVRKENAGDVMTVLFADAVIDKK
jgi:hypothetical protein